MARVVRFHETGGPDVLKVEDVEVPAPQAGEVQIRLTRMDFVRKAVSSYTLACHEARRTSSLADIPA